MALTVARFGFRFDPRFRLPLALIGVRPGTATVTVEPDRLLVRYGPWRLRTDRRNIVGIERTGPYRWWRAIGPRLSLADAGVTFGTGADGGVCLRFATPVSALLPGGLLRHPAATLTVADPEAFLTCLDRPAGRLRAGA